MASKFMFVIILLFVLALLDLYVFQSVRVATLHSSPAFRKWVYLSFWAVSVLSLVGIAVFNFTPIDRLGKGFRTVIMIGTGINYFSKAFVLLFLLVDDLSRAGQWVYKALFDEQPLRDIDVSRSEFLMKTAVLAGGVPLVTMTFGIVSGAHDYQVRKKTILLPNLPKAFDGIRFAQLSDIHSGSFFNKTAVQGGIQMLLDEKPDVVFFTGDIVNNTADEMKGWTDVFGKVKAPLGVYSSLGNHDYGDYVIWPNAEAKAANLTDLKRAHREMGWDLIMNDHRYIEATGERLAVIGVENWSTKARFPKYGNLSKAHKGAEADTKILLSHDPSHWDGEVTNMYKDIDLMLAGHTHGMQFGIEIGNFRWSPVQYLYEQWADLYQKGDQYVYVNRGFGYIGYPGRIGILPEITILELKRG